MLWKRTAVARRTPIPTESAPPAVSVPMDGLRAPTNRWRPASRKKAARSRTIGPARVTVSSLVEKSSALLPDESLPVSAWFWK